MTALVVAWLSSLTSRQKFLDSEADNVISLEVQWAIRTMKLNVSYYVRDKQQQQKLSSQESSGYDLSINEVLQVILT